MINRLPALVLLCCLMRPAAGQDFTAYAKMEFVRDGHHLPYRILYPENYDRHRRYPLILFLHGSGQLGNDNERQLIHGGNFFLKDSLRKRFPAIVIFPQCPQNAIWSYLGFHYDSSSRSVDLLFKIQPKPAIPSMLLKALADSLLTAGSVDSNRIYIGGLSLGGFGTYDFIERYPGYFAAAFPICAGGDTTCAPLLARHTAVWIFHGAADPLINVRYARQYFQALTRAGGDVKYSEYPGVKHNSWDNAFQEPGLMEWLFSKTKK